MTQEERLESIKGAFAVKRNYFGKIENAPTVFLIDDIVTTGATFREARIVLKKARAGRVYGVALAHG